MPLASIEMLQLATTSAQHEEMTAQLVLNRQMVSTMRPWTGPRQMVGQHLLCPWWDALGAEVSWAMELAYLSGIAHSCSLDGSSLS